MVTTETVATIKFWREGEHGALRIGETRVPLEAVYYKFINGATAEEIVDCYPALKLSEAHAAIAYILDNREAVDEYIREGEIYDAKVEAELRAKNGKEMDEFRDMIRARAVERGLLPKP
jgi:uncharacterized protein (DUF433 family)